MYWYSKVGNTEISSESAEDQHLPLQESEFNLEGVTSCSDKTNHSRSEMVIFRKAYWKDWPLSGMWKLGPQSGVNK